MYATRSSESLCRKRLEYCYDHGLLEEAIMVGNILDRMQWLLLMREQEKDVNRKPAFSISFELSRA